MLYAPFPDLLDVNEVANRGQKPIALNPSNPKTYKIYRKEMMQSGGLRYRTYNQLFGPFVLYDAYYRTLGEEQHKKFVEELFIELNIVK